MFFWFICMQRKSTLLVEYCNRNKNNLFVDRRLGEKDKSMDEQLKMDLRRVKEMKKKVEKVGLVAITF